MNYPMIGRLLGWVLLITAGLLLLPLAAAAVYAEGSVALAFGVTAAVCALLGLGLTRLKPVRRELYAREGFVIVGLSWLGLALLGALPYVISGDIPNYIDALFETISGLTTTGATIVTDIEGMSRGCMFWRCFTHWIGGMGILVFLMAVVPMSGSYSMHIMRAEVPGPTVGKLVPRARKTASILYLIYVGLTVLETVFLLFGGMSFYEALLHAFSNAGTGGFSTRAASIAGFHSPYVEWVIGVFSLLFAVNFNLYYLILIRRWRTALQSEELWWYLGIVVGVTLAITAGIARSCGGFGSGLRTAFFQVTTIVSTTGFSTANHDLWPEYCKGLLILLTILGGCAGSTCGGLKLSRFMILLRAAGCELRRLLRPRAVSRVRLEGKTVSEDTVRSTTVYFFLCIAIVLATTLVLTLDGFDPTTNFTGALTCFFNVGPGLNLVGPAGNYAMFSPVSKLALSWCMLAGRLEIYPVLLLMTPSMWKRA